MRQPEAPCFLRQKDSFVSLVIRLYIKDNDCQPLLSALDITQDSGAAASLFWHEGATQESDKESTDMRRRNS